MSDFGGLIKFRLPDGRNVTVRGSVTHMPTRFSSDKIANHDGTLDRTITPKGYGFSLSCSNRAVDGDELDWESIMGITGVTLTFLHDSERIDRAYTGAFLYGDVSIDAMTGEVTGISGASEGYQAIPR